MRAMNTADYMARLRELAARPTVYAVAQLLDLPEQTVRNYAKGKSCPDTFGCVRIAELLDLDPMQVIADVEAEREKDEGRRARWRELSRKLGGSALVVICSTMPTTADCEAALHPTPYSTTSVSAGFCIMSIALRRLWQWLCPLGSGRFPAFGS